MLFHSSTRLEVIQLKAVVGTVEPTNMFDADFRPASEPSGGPTSRRG
jgi:hypothetical protein